MSATLRVYLLKHFLKLTLTSVLTLGALFLVFDILAQSDDVLAGGMVAWKAVLLYGALRFPQILSLVMPIAGMLAIIGVYAKLHGQLEVTAMTSAGIRLTRVVGVFIFGAFVVAALHFIFLNSVVIEASKNLRHWQENDFRPTSEQAAVTRYPAWFEVEDKILFVQNAADDNSVLKNVKIIERGPDGIMQTYTMAGEARHLEGTRWQLNGVDLRKLETGETVKAADRKINLNSKPEDLAIFNKKIEEMALEEMWTLTQASHLTNNMGYYYDTWFQRRFSQPLSTVVMMLIATPLLFMRPRQRNKTGLFFGVVLLGFVFFIGERIALAMGETGEIPASLSVWGPPAAFAGVMFLYLLWQESPLARR